MRCGRRGILFKVSGKRIYEKLAEQTQIKLAGKEFVFFPANSGKEYKFFPGVSGKRITVLEAILFPITLKRIPFLCGKLGKVDKFLGMSLGLCPRDIPRNLSTFPRFPHKNIIFLVIRPIFE